MKSARIAPLLFLLSGCLRAQTGPAANNTVKPEDQCLVEGKVLNALTGEPLKKAHVSLRRADATTMNTPPYGATTDAAGHFVIEKIDPGRYHLSADRTGFVRSDMSPKKLAAVPDTLTLSEGQRLGDLKFKLTPQAVISGRVVDEDNEPVSNASVLCARYRFMNGKKSLVPVGNSITNDKGEYRAFGLAAGRYYVSATYSLFNMGPTEIRADAAPEEGYLSTYYPAAMDPASAVQVSVAAGGETSSVDIRLLRAKTFLVSGRLTNPSASSQAQIMLEKHEGSEFNWASVKRAMTDAKGHFVVRGVSPGLYDLRAIEFRSEQQRFATMPVTVGDSNVTDVQLSFGAHPDLQGVLSIENSPAPAQPAQDNTTVPAVYHINVFPENNTQMFGVSDGEVKEDRTFTLKNVTPQKYRVSVYPLEGDAYVKRVSVGDKEYMDGRIDFSGGVEAGEVRIIVSMNGGEVEGSVLDSKHQASPQATVVLVPDRAEATQRYKSATTDQNGHYVVRGIEPGKYKVYALDQIDAGAYYDAEYMKAFASGGESVEVAERAKLTQDLQLIVNDEVQ